MSAWLPGPGWLFCPADRPERYVKALDRADVVILDLEDAVARPAKAAARDAVRRLSETGGLDLDRTVVRVNAADDAAEHAHDVALLAAAGVRRVMLAKAEEPAAVAALAAGGAHEVLPLLETPRGIENAGPIAATDGVVAVMWGADDLVAAMGGTGSRRADGSYRDVARYARERTLVAAKAHGRLALDAVHMDIADTDGLAAAAEDAAAVGFDATVAIHPSQVAVIRAAYAPSPERLAWAGGTARGVPRRPVRRRRRRHPRGPDGRRPDLRPGAHRAASGGSDHPAEGPAER
ncbi:HpcH/HpaI aldolase/citrate lyase family protein [Nocardioides zeae]|uniref:Citrate lyase subunit beta/citryl-CoA lyase n=1 Tax=Nocardioides zeae TaxID=1457234 RepID=A0AAJ1U9L9_9ACTN|nr:aldolase/citrate lyase family protein [Nocardioides zeae]MDQ1106652.1 citrate lyase subunit beta/citryl-CoA lyase [Nocardioides zeae]